MNVLLLIGNTPLGASFDGTLLRFGLNSLLPWLVVALPFVILLAASLFGFFLHLREFLLLFGCKGGGYVNSTSRLSN
jgi:hypothetical protein